MSAFSGWFATGLNRLQIFVYDIVVLVGLAILAVVYVECHKPNGFLAGAIDLTPWSGYGLYVRAMWFGALGGVIISLKGVYDHRGGSSPPWEGGYNLWHLGRPISGAIAGLMTFLLLKVLNLKGASAPPPSDYIVYVAAFVFGTQERRFFNLLYEIAKLIVTVPDDGGERGPRLVAIEPDAARPGDVVIVRGVGIGKGASAKLGGQPLEKAIVADDGSSIAGLAPAGVAGNAPVDVMVVNVDGASFVLPGKFRFRAHRP
jgi:hypothetical protein